MANTVQVDVKFNVAGNLEKAFKEIEEQNKKIAKVIEDINKSTQGTAKEIDKVAKSTSALDRTFESLGKAATKVFDGIKSALLFTGELIAGYYIASFVLDSNQRAAITKSFVSFFDDLVNLDLKKIFSGFKGFLTSIGNDIGQFLSFLKNDALTSFSGLFSNISTQARSFSQALITSLSNEGGFINFGSAFDKVVANLQAGFAKISSLFRNFIAAAPAFFDEFLTSAFTFTETLLARFNISFASIAKVASGAFDAILTTSKTFFNSFGGLSGIFSSISQSFGGLTTILKEFGELLGFVSHIIGATFGSAISALGSTFTGFLGYITKSFPLLSNLGGFFSAMGSQVLAVTKGLYGFVDAIIFLGPVLIGLGSLLKDSDNQFVRMIGTISIIAGVITSTLTFAIIHVITKLGELTFNLGTKLVDASKSSVDAFTDLESKVFAFDRTITNLNKIYGDVIGNTASWTATIKALGKETGTAESELVAASKEIVLVGSSFGFTEKEMQKLLALSVDLAKSFKKDIFETAVQVSGAIAGNTQGLVAYGIKLGDAAIEAKELAKGNIINVSSLSELEKIQLRVNQIFSQSTPLQGAAAASLGTLAGQSAILQANLKNLNQEYGRGAAVIENIQIASLAFNKTIGLLSPEIVNIAGFMGALGGRVLQVIGLVLEFSFTIFGLTKAFTLLKAALETDFIQELFAKNLPFVNKSLVTMAGNVGIVSTELRTLQGVAKLTLAGLLESLKFLAASLLGVEAASLTLGTAFTALGARIVTLGSLIATTIGTITSFLLTNPIVGTIVAITAAVIGLYKAFEFIEKQTGALSIVFNVFKEVLTEATVITEFFGKVFSSVIDFAKRSFFSFMGLATQLLTEFLQKFIQFIAITATISPLKILDDSQITKLNIASDKLQNLQDRLHDADLNIAALKPSAEQATRAIASLGDTHKNIIPLSEAFKKLQEELKNVGLTQTEIVRKESQERLKIITDELKKNPAIHAEAAALTLKVNQDLQKKLTDINKKAIEERKQAYEKEQNKIKESAKALGQFRDEMKKLGDTAFKNPFADIDKEIQESLDKLKGKYLTAEARLEIQTQVDATIQLTNLSRLAGVVAQIAKGAEGASNFLGGIVSTLFNGTDAIKKSLEKSLPALAAVIPQLAGILPGFGPIAAELFSVFSKGPDAVRQMVREFFQAIPELIKNFILAVPAFIDELVRQVPILIRTLAQNIGPIITEFVRQIPVIIDSIIESLPEIVVALAEAMPQVALALIGALVPGFGLFNLKIDGAATNFASKIGDLAEKFYEKIVQGLEKIGKFIYEKLVEGITKFYEYFLELGKDFVGKIWQFFLDIGGVIIGRIWELFINIGGVIISRIWELFINLGSTIVANFFGIFSNFAIVTISNIFGSFFDFGIQAVQKFFGSFLEQGLNFLKDLLSKIPVVGGFLGGDGGNPLGSIPIVGDVFEGVSDVFGFARGGWVPDKPQYANDRFPARLSAGEYVVRDDLAQRLDNFLARENSGNNNAMSEDMLFRILDQVSRPVQVESTVQLNGQAFATIMQTLNRSNTRLT